MPPPFSKAHLTSPFLFSVGAPANLSARRAVAGASFLPGASFPVWLRPCMWLGGSPGDLMLLRLPQHIPREKIQLAVLTFNPALTHCFDSEEPLLPHL